MRTTTPADQFGVFVVVVRVLFFIGDKSYNTPAGATSERRSRLAVGLLTHFKSKRVSELTAKRGILVRLSQALFRIASMRKKRAEMSAILRCATRCDNP